MVGAAIIAPAGNTACMNLHLQEISAISIAAPVCVGAGRHELEVPNNVLSVARRQPPVVGRADRSSSGKRLQPAQRLTQVILDVIDIFETDRDADDTIRNA